MPEMDGLQTYQALKAIRDDVAIILITGYAVDDRMESVVAEGCRYLRKPFTRFQLAKTIASIMPSSETAAVDTENHPN